MGFGQLEEFTHFDGDIHSVSKTNRIFSRKGKLSDGRNTQEFPLGQWLFERWVSIIERIRTSLLEYNPFNKYQYKGVNKCEYNVNSQV